MFSEDKGGRCVGLTTLPPSCADCLEIWDPQPPGTLRPVQACNGIALHWACPVGRMGYRLNCQILSKVMIKTNNNNNNNNNLIRTEATQIQVCRQ